MAISIENETSYKGSSPIAIIEMDYHINNNSWSSDYGRETWEILTIDAKPISDFESATEVLCESYIFVESSRSIDDYKAYFDRENNIELRFKYENEKLHTITFNDIPFICIFNESVKGKCQEPL